MSIFDRYTDQAKRAVFFAQKEAVHRDQKCITAADLLAGLTWEDCSRACRIAPLKERVLEIKALLGIPHRPTTAVPYLQKADIPLDNDSKKALAYAAKEANRNWEYWIDTDHLLRGLLRFENPAGKALRAVGISLLDVRSGSRKSRADRPSAPIPKLKVAKHLFREHALRLLLLTALAILFLYLKFQS